MWGNKLLFVPPEMFAQKSKLKGYLKYFSTQMYLKLKSFVAIGKRTIVFANP